MSSDDIYYVYAYLDPVTREPFYIGKGKNGRAYDHFQECKNPNNTLPRHHKIRKILKRGKAPIVIFPYTNLKEDEAFEKECSLIAHYGRRDIGTGCLLNMSDGGEGNTGHRYCQDPSEYEMTNIFTREKVWVTRLQMREELGIDRASVCCLMKGRKKHSRGWYLGDIPPDFSPKRKDPHEKHVLVNTKTKEEMCGVIHELSEITGLTGKEISALVDGRLPSIRGWTYETVDGKSFKNHGRTYTIINIHSREVYTGTQREICDKIGSKCVYHIINGGYIKGWILGAEVTEDTIIRYDKDHKFLLRNKETNEEAMMSVNDLQNIRAKSKAFEVMRRKRRYQGWYRV